MAHCRLSLALGIFASWLLVALCALPALSAAEPQLLGRTRDQWLADLDPNVDRRKRTLAAWALSEMAVQQAEGPDKLIWLNELLLLCEDESGTIRYWALAGVRRFALKLPADHAGRATAVTLFSDALIDSSVACRIVAAEGLTVLGAADKGLPVLVGTLANPQEAARIQAVSALERLGDTAQPAEQALQAATKDSSEYVKRISSRALEKLQPPR
ncbi:MAG: hypothetical protein SFU86_24695 [Pirellulaceae bacterium]|nr:hypothetical protein [Pirellulaceae bacterium]